MIRSIWALFATEEEKKERKKLEKKKNLMKDKLKIEQLEISGHFFNNKKKIIINLKE